jgi:hypothetical protein
MKTYSVIKVQVGGAAAEQHIEADRCTVDLSGALQFWRGEEREEMVKAFAAGRWYQVEEVPA